MSALRKALDDVEKVVQVIQLRDSGIGAPGFDKYTTHELAKFLTHYAVAVLAETEPEGGD